MALPCVQVVTTAIGSEGMHMEDYVAAEVSRCGIIVIAAAAAILVLAS